VVWASSQPSDETRDRSRQMETLLTDLRYSVRTLLKSKGVTLVAVISLAAGIGANSAIFSLVNSILLRPRPVASPEQLVELYAGDRDTPYETLSYPSYLEFRERNQVFTGLAAYGLAFQFKIRGADDVEQVWGEVVSGNYFDVLGVPAFAGRTFAAEEDSVPGRNPVVVIAHGLWVRRFNADPGIIGKTINVNNQPLTVVGVAPPQYTGMLRGLACEIWVPAMVMPLLDPARGRYLLTRDSKWATLVGRLKPDVTLERARSRFDVLSKEMQRNYPDEWLKERGSEKREMRVSVLPESEVRVHPSMRPVAYALAVLLFAIVDLVLLIACMNLASMLFARAVVRRGEIAVRLALGAGRFRILRQLLTESVLLALVSGAVGIVAAIWGLHMLVAFMPPLPEGMRIALDVQLDWRVVAYTLVFATITGLLFGLAPALHATRSALSSVLKDDSTALTTRHRKSGVRLWLVVGQVAFSLLLLIGAGLVLRSLEKVRPTRLGFTSSNIVVAPISLDEVNTDRRAAHQFYERLSERIAAIPGVRAVSLVEGMPGGFMSRTRRSTEIEGYVPSAREDMEIDASYVGPGHFTSVKMPFVQGRDFDSRDRDGAPCVAIVNEVFARRYLAGSALGKHLAKYEGARDQRQNCAIVGVISDNGWSRNLRMTLMVHAEAAPASLTPAVRRTIRELDPRMPVNDVQTLDQYFSVGLFPFRLLGVVIGGCGLLALFLATVGLYGVLSYSVAQRRREVGVRLALGALHGDILKLVVGQGMGLVGYGLAAGALLSFALTRVLTSLPLNTELLFGVSATDSLTFAGVTMLLALVALVACYLPARRAAKVDPMVALRN
jgi:putative ABC transport system permease protein